jgi:aspartate/methionine/tyrosine aminotransferase
VSQRSDRVPAFHAMAMSRLASERELAGHQVLHLEVGQPSTGAPQAAREAVTEALGRPDITLGYTGATGLYALRRRIAEQYLTDHAVTVTPEQIMIVSGASAGFTLAFLAAFEPGARVGVLEPGYPCYRNTLWALDMTPVMIPVGPETRWAPTTEILDQVIRDHGALDGLIIASPSNPTGTVLSATALQEITTYCSSAGIRLIADEIYHGITYTGPAASAVGLSSTAIVINSFSKYYSMTGWRVGWMVIPSDLIGPVERLQQNLYICAPHVSQVAALAAMDARNELDLHLIRYRENREILLDGLRRAGITEVADADGAFYVYADVGHLTTDRPGGPIDSMALCLDWLNTIGVACTPGVDFDLQRGHHQVRFSYAGPTAQISEAAHRLTHWARS